jgi:hypothetical protein
MSSLPLEPAEKQELFNTAALMAALYKPEAVILTQVESKDWATNLRVVLVNTLPTPEVMAEVMQIARQHNLPFTVSTKDADGFLHPVALQ